MESTDNKGTYYGICNRTACDESPAEYYNYATQKYYCEGCADKINLYNRKEAFELYGHDLCLHETRKRQEPILLKFENPYQDIHLAQVANERITESFVRPIPNDLKNAKTVPVRTEPKIGRNDQCSCGSGLKYKKCCGK